MSVQSKIETTPAHKRWNTRHTRHTGQPKYTHAEHELYCAHLLDGFQQGNKHFHTQRPHCCVVLCEPLQQVVEATRRSKDIHKANQIPVNVKLRRILSDEREKGRSEPD